MPQIKLPEDFIYAVQYYRAPTPPPKDWENDLKAIKELGFNTIQVRPQWRWHERVKGQIVWDDIDRLFDLSEKHGLRVIFKFMLETAPAWLFREYQCERVDNQGQKILPYQNGAYYVGGWWPCFDHPMVRHEANRLIDEAVRRYKDRKSLLVWNVWNEPRSRPLGDCCCEESRKCYRAWLKERYGTIEGLNGFLGKAWGSFDEVDPPAGTEDYAEIHLFRQWAAHSVMDRVAWVKGRIGAIDTLHPIMTHVGTCSLRQRILDDISDDWLNARQVDFYGGSFIDGVERVNDLAEAALINDWLRSNSKYYWVQELYAHSPYYSEAIEPESIRLWAWTSLAHGAKGINYWQYKDERFGNESNGYGLVRPDGERTERAREASVVAKVIAEHGRLFRRFETRPAEIALFYDVRSDLVSHAEERRHLERLTGDYTYKDSLRGAYNLFWRLNLPVDWVSAHEAERLLQYRLVYLPAPMLVDPPLARLLEEFVRRGGVLISEASPAMREENTWTSEIVPGQGLDKLFGCRQETRLADYVYGDAKPKAFFRLASERRLYPAYRIITILKPSTARVAGTWQDGTPAVTINEYGQGRAVLIGMYAGLSYERTKNNTPATANILPPLLRLLGTDLGGPAEIKGHRSRVGLRALYDGREILLFLFNYSTRPEKCTITRPHLLHPRLIFPEQGILRPAGKNLALEIAPRSAVCIHAAT